VPDLPIEALNLVEPPSQTPQSHRKPQEERPKRGGKGDEEAWESRRGGPTETQQAAIDQCGGRPAEEGVGVRRLEDGA